MALFREGELMREFIKSIVRDVVKEETRSCFRTYKAKIISPPNGTSCSVQLIGEYNVLKVPYSSKMATAAVGDIVWIAVPFGSLKNAIVWETGDFQ